jgi:hypothetical protein
MSNAHSLNSTCQHKLSTTSNTITVTEKDTIPLLTKRYIHPAAEPIAHTKRRQDMWMSTQQNHKIPGPDCGALWGGLEDIMREAKSGMWEVGSTWLM